MLAELLVKGQSQSKNRLGVAASLLVLALSGGQGATPDGISSNATTTNVPTSSVLAGASNVSLENAGFVLAPNLTTDEPQLENPYAFLNNPRAFFNAERYILGFREGGLVTHLSTYCIGSEGQEALVNYQLGSDGWYVIYADGVTGSNPLEDEGTATCSIITEMYFSGPALSELLEKLSVHSEETATDGETTPGVFDDISALIQGLRRAPEERISLRIELATAAVYLDGQAVTASYDVIMHAEVADPKVNRTADASASFAELGGEWIQTDHGDNGITLGNSLNPSEVFFAQVIANLGFQGNKYNEKVIG